MIVLEAVNPHLLLFSVDRGCTDHNLISSQQYIDLDITDIYLTTKFRSQQ